MASLADRHFASHGFTFYLAVLLTQGMMRMPSVPGPALSEAATQASMM